MASSGVVWWFRGSTQRFRWWSGFGVVGGSCSSPWCSVPLLGGDCDRYVIDGGPVSTYPEARVPLYVILFLLVVNAIDLGWGTVNVMVLS
ncbi:hypothetical protein QL285_003458 [Trifolium repens]|nr:hypothetical protein QL285_003458 [Trifolium repens]